jgi:hydrogenase maturation protease
MMSPDRPIPLLVLGLGNILCSDDGVGPAAVNLLMRRYEVPQGVRVLDGGTLGLCLLPYIEDAKQVLLVDAVRADRPPGSLVRLEGDAVAPAILHRLSVHQIGVADLLDGARWLERYPDQLILLGLVPETLKLGLARSAAVEAQLPKLVARIVAVAHQLGYEFRSKANDEMGVLGSHGDVARLFGLP